MSKQPLPRVAAAAAALLALLAVLPVSACEPAAPFDGLSEAAIRGWNTYRGRCGACHHYRNPHLDTAVAPAVARSSAELLAAKVLRNEYPEGYTPKRETTNMTVMPFLTDRIDDLAAFLAEVPDQR